MDFVRGGGFFKGEGSSDKLAVPLKVVRGESEAA